MQAANAIVKDSNLLGEGTHLGGCLVVKKGGDVEFRWEPGASAVWRPLKLLDSSLHLNKLPSSFPELHAVGRWVVYFS